MTVVATRLELTLPPRFGPYGVILTPLLHEIYGPARLAVGVLLGVRASVAGRRRDLAP